MTDNTEIAALLSARICHDLVSPVGAVVNGVGLVQEIAGPSLTEELAMIGQSAGRASSLLQFYRIAFGASDDDGSEVSRSSVQIHANQLVTTQKVNFDMTGVDGAPLPRSIAKNCCLMILCAKSLVGLRGTVHVSIDPAPRPAIHVSARTTGSIANPDFVQILRTPVEPSAVPPRAVEFLLLKAAIEQAGAQMTLDLEDAAATISLSGM